MRSLDISNHVNLVFVRYFDEMYVVSPLVVLCEHRLHDTSVGLGPREKHCEVLPPFHNIRCIGFRASQPF